MKRLTDASVQPLVLSLICFCCPGLFNALTSFTSGLADPAHIVAIFLVAARVRHVRLALILGSGGYVCYAAALYHLQAPVIDASLEVYYAACAALGLSAGFLWTAQGRMVMSYATSENQGSYLSTFWIIFNLGAAAGGFVSFALNFSREELPAATTEHASGMMYAVFIILMSAGVLLAAFGIVDSDQVVREDGTTPADNFRANEPRKPWWTEIRRQLTAARTEQVHTVVCLLPLFAYSNWFYTYHSFFNVTVFNMRSSGLASSFCWLAQMGAAYAVGWALDTQVFKKTKRHQTRSPGSARVVASTVADVGVRSLILFALLANAT
ncbi:DUF895 domain membrane protein [Phytophthora pseudosyringae]|uniref:DUF895 domain membrane protein n=1 Tax=Phytophthora pseudosyringae TaxID=221518 RepID=A0A8T1VF73_9STRA|nr:DUF895 domain membrane protein [Phytophthora pseudosyringae]